jgi:LmbE family N-acetylglucosaminyl deacetylase
MIPLLLTAEKDQPLTLLCLGAHSDDIEIGCGATILTLVGHYSRLKVHWVVFSAAGARGEEATRSAKLFLRGVEKQRLVLHEFRDGFFPWQGAAIKEVFEELKRELKPDLTFTHCRHDRHQDHRLVNELTWNTWRDHLILEYEVPKYDADLASPNVYVPVTAQAVKKKVDHLLKCFGTQRSKQWFDEETFRGLLRLRGLECAATSRYAEAFYARKLVLR